MRRKPRKPLKPLELVLGLSEPFASSEKGQRLLKEWDRASSKQRRRFVQAQRQAAVKQPAVWRSFRNQIDYLRRYDRRLRLETKRAAKKLRQVRHVMPKVQTFLRQAHEMVGLLAYQMASARASLAKMAEASATP